MLVIPAFIRAVIDALGVERGAKGEFFQARLTIHLLLYRRLLLSFHWTSPLGDVGGESQDGSSPFFRFGTILHRNEPEVVQRQVLLAGDDVTVRQRLTATALHIVRDARASRTDTKLGHYIVLLSVYIIPSNRNIHELLMIY